jgi:2-isopropylmalate synthase
MLKAKKTFEIMTPQSVGLKDSRMNLTSRSGSHMVKARLMALGYNEKEFDIEAFYKRFIELADKKGTVYDDDLVSLMESKTAFDMTDAYAMEYLNVSSGKVHQEAACGDGAVDAATKAIDRITGFKIAIEDFTLTSVTEGREALGKVKMIARANEGVFTGIGTSTDIVEASALAYMDVVNKIARMKRFKKTLPSAKK